jgi:hypothetical protein
MVDLAVAMMQVLGDGFSAERTGVSNHQTGVFKQVARKGQPCGVEVKVRQ